MTAEKKAAESAKKADEGTRKAWVPRTPVEVVIDQITKVERRVDEMQKDLDTEKAMLTKLLQAKKLLESV